MPVRDRLGNGALVEVVGHRPDQAHRHRLDPAGNQLGHRLPHLLRVQPHQHGALVVHPLVHLLDQRPRDHGRGLVEPGQMKDFRLGDAVREAPAHDAERVGKPLGRNQAGDGAGSRKERVVTDGAGVEEKAGGPEQLVVVLEPEVPGGVPHRVQRPHRVVVRRGQRLPHRHGATGIHGDAVGESATDVDADKVSASGNTHKHLILRNFFE